MNVCFILLFISSTYSPFSFAKKRCKPFLKKLHNIQATQRKSYSLKRGESLRAKEDKARDKWWQCENSSLAKFKAQYGSSKKENNKSKQSKNKKSKQRNAYVKKSKKVNVYSETVNFNQDSAIVIRAKYQGKKHLAWLDFYRKPKQCQRLKNMSVFAYCHEDKRLQQSEFDKLYRE